MKEKQNLMVKMEANEKKIHFTFEDGRVVGFPNGDQARKFINWAGNARRVLRVDASGCCHLLQ